MDSKKRSLLVLLFLTFFALGAGFYLKRRLEVRKGAYFTTATMMFRPDKEEVSQNDRFNLSLFVNSGDKKVSGFRLVLNYDPEKLKFLGEKIVRVANMPFTETIIIREDQSGQIQLVKVAKLRTENLMTGPQLLAILGFEAIGTGEAAISLKRVELVGFNPQLEESQPDVSFKIEGDQGTRIRIKAATGEGSGPRLKILTKIKGVTRPQRSQIPVSVKLGRGSQIVKEYTNLQGQLDQEGNLTVVVNLGQIEPADDYFLLLKVQGGLQKKYCMNWQKTPCSAGGSLSLGGRDEVVIKEADYPVEMGDVNGDGVVNSVDLSLVKKSLGQNNPEGDVDLNGVNNSRDIVILLMTLSEKYDEDF